MTDGYMGEAVRVARLSGRRVGIFPTGCDDGRFRHWDWVSETPGQGFTGAGADWRNTLQAMVLPDGSVLGMEEARRVAGAAGGEAEGE